MKTKDNKLLAGITDESYDIPKSLISGSIKTIYLVKYKEIHYMPESKRVQNNTYTLCTFETLNMAKEYLDVASECIISPNITGKDFRIMLKNDTEKNNDKIILERNIRLVGNSERNRSQSKLFIFTIESVKFKSSNSS